MDKTTLQVNQKGFAFRQMAKLKEAINFTFEELGVCDFINFNFTKSNSTFFPPPPQEEEEIIPAGSYIINMGVQPQTIATAIKPYGLIWHLLHEYEIPICWSINPDKAKDGVDFTYNGIDFKGGPFIIKAEYRSMEVNALIQQWEAQGVVGVTTTSEITVPIARILNYSMNWTLNLKNGQIAQSYLDAAGIPSTAYDWTLPENLNCCNDVFLMPHSEPIWQTHHNILTWNASEEDGGCRGTLWAGCKAGSEVENIVNPNDNSQRMNFLMLPPVAPATTPAVWSGDHEDGTLPPPYIYKYPSHPVMQFLGSTDGSQENGAEQVYLPTIGWRPTTLIGIQDDDHPDVPSISPGPAAKLAFGPAFGDESRGYICYQAGHRLNKDNNPENIASQRAFFNFSFLAVGQKAIHVSSNIPSEMDAGRTYNLSVSATGGSGNYYYKWTSNCPGIISNPFASSITFTAGSVLSATQCNLKVTVTDDCGTRVGFSNVAVTILPTPAPPVAIDDFEETRPGEAVTVNALANDSDPNFDPITLTTLLGPTNTGNGEFVNIGNGQVTYTPNFDFVGVDQIPYVICDNTPLPDGGPLCDTATIFITVDWIDENGCFPNEYHKVVSEGFADAVIAENSISNSAGALGEPILVSGSNTYYAKIDNNSDYLVIDLTDILQIGDTIFVYFGADDGNLAVLNISSTLTGNDYSGGNGFFNLQSFATTSDLNDGNPQQDKAAYVVQDGPVRYLRFTREKNMGKPSVNGVYYSIKDCVNAEPEANDDAVSLCEDHDAIIDVLANDSDPQELPLTLTLLSTTQHGTLGMQNDGTIKYQPETDYSGSEHFTYQICNTNGLCDQAVVNITIYDDGCPNGYFMDIEGLDETVADNFPTNTYNNNTGTQSWSTNWMEEGDDGVPNSGKIKASGGMIECAVDGDYAIYRGVNLANTNSATLLFDVSGHNLNNEDTYVLEASKNGGATYQTLKTFTVLSPTNSSESFDLKQTLGSLSSTVRIRFRRSAGSGNEKFRFDNVQIQYQVAGCYGSCQPIPTYPPTAIDDYAVTPINTPVVVQVQLNDIDPSSLGLTTHLGFSDLPDNGAFELVGNKILYTPHTGFVGQDIFNYSICNSYGCDSALVTIDVLCTDPANGTAIQGMVFNDANNSADFNLGEHGIANIKVRLFEDANKDGNLDAGEEIIDSSFTDNQGNYVFQIENGSISNSSSTTQYPVRATGKDYSDNELLDLTNAPNGVMYKIRSGNYITLEFPEIIPFGATVIIYLASDRASGKASISSSLNGSTFVNPTIWIPSYNNDPGNPPPSSAIQTFNYQVSAANGAKFIKIEGENNNTYLDGASSKKSINLGGGVTVALSRSINSGADDAEEEGPDGSFLGPGKIYLASSDLELTQDFGFPSSGTQKIGLRFNTINVPQGATITSATLKFRAISADFPNSNSGATALTIKGQAADNATTFLNVTNNISNRALTSASALWNPSTWSSNNNYSSPDLSTIVQEIVDRPGWVDGNSLAFVISGNGSRSAYSYNGSATYAPKLDITYTLGGGAANGHYILQLDPATFPINSILSTDNIETAVVLNNGDVDCANNFGIIDHLPPVANPDTVYVDEGVLVNIKATDNDYDPEGTPLDLTIISNPVNGTATNNGNGSVSFISNIGFIGWETFPYYVCDQGTPSLCDTSTITVIVSPFVNNPPEAMDDYDTTVVNNAVETDVLDNDFDQEFGVLTAQLTPGILQPSHGAAIVLGNSTIEYTPDPGFTGDDTYEYIVCDDEIPSLCDTATVFIHVLNRPPDAIPDESETGLNTPVNIDVLENDFEPDGHDIILLSAGAKLDATGNSTVFGGSTLLKNNGTPNDPTDDFITYFPPMGFLGVDTFYYRIQDSGTPAGYDITYVTIKVTPMVDLELTKIVDPDTAYLGDDLTFTLTLINKGPSVATSVLVKDKLTTSYSYLGDTGGGAYDPSSGVWHIPSLGVNQTVSLDINAKVSNPSALKNVTEVIACNQKDADSTPNNDDGDQSEDDEDSATPFIIEICDNGIDDDGDGLTDCEDPDCNGISITMSGGATICPGTPAVLFAKASGNTGPFSYEWSNGLGTGQLKTVTPTLTTTYTVTVTNANDCTAAEDVTVSLISAPVANAGADVTVCRNRSTTLTATATGGSAPYNFSWSNAPGTGNNLVVTPLTTTTYTVTVTSDNGCNSTDQITVTVNNCVEICGNGLDDDNDGLVDCEDSDCGPQVDAGSPVNTCAGESTQLSATSTGGNGTVSFQWDNGLGNSQNPVVNPTTTTTYHVTVTAANSGCTHTDSVTVNIIICSENCTNGIDDDGNGLVDCDDPNCAGVTAPVLVDDHYTTCPGMPFSDRVTYNDGNLQYPTFSIYSDPINGTVTINNTGKFTYTPFTIECMTDSFEYQVCNTVSGCCSQASVTIEVGDTNAPLLINVPVDLTIGCDDVVPMPTEVVAFDECPGIYIDYEETSDQYYQGACGSYTLVRKWTATDLCGNSVTDSQRITILDQTKPEIFQVYTLESGQRVVAGVAKRVTHDWKYVPFPITFSTTPLIFSTVATNHDLSAVTTRQRNPYSQGFELRLYEEENADGTHQPEDVTWIAIEPGTNAGDLVLEAARWENMDHHPTSLAFSALFGNNPGMLAQIQSTNDEDPVGVRFNSIDNGSVQAFLQEETSGDAEISHNYEHVGHLVFKPGTDLNDQKGKTFGESGQINISNVWTTVHLNRSYTKPVVVMGGLSNNDPSAVNVRIRNITRNSFEARLQEWDYLDGNHSPESVSWMAMEGSIPGNMEYYCSGNVADLQVGINLFALDNCDDHTAFGYSESPSITANGTLTTRVWMAIDDCGNTSLITRYDTCTTAALQLRAQLFGALVNSGNGSLMRDNLRTQNLIPLEEPYSSLPGFPHVTDSTPHTTAPSNNELPEGHVYICHKPGTSAERTLIVNENALNAHLAHGDHYGSCSGNDSGEPAGAVNADFKTIADGDWNDPNTWEGGNIPSNNILNNKKISIEHHVTLQDGNLRLKGNSILWISNTSLTMGNGNFTIEDAEVSIFEAEIEIKNGSFELTKSAAVLSMNYSTLTVSQSFTNQGGERWLENVFMEIGGHYVNSGGHDNLIFSSGTIQSDFDNNSGGIIEVLYAKLNSKSGKFKNSTGSEMKGDNLVIWSETGGIINTGIWIVPITQYCISDEAIGVGLMLPISEDCAGMADYFSKGYVLSPLASISNGGNNEPPQPVDVSLSGTLDPVLLQETNENAIVDWMLLELRDPNDEGKIMAYATVALQRDGDIVDEDGNEVINFPNLLEGNYYVAIHHRNHLPMMTDIPMFLSITNVPMIDFTDESLPLRGEHPGRVHFNARSMWGGDFNEDGKVVYQGPYNDIFFLFSRTLSDVNNVDHLANFIVYDYDLHDFNLDGKVIYQGPNNDRAMLLYNSVLAHPGNKNFLANFIAEDMLP
ncbi:MAG: Ig-like domain-containing protein [Saprospiraceae bacterium]